MSQEELEGWIETLEVISDPKLVKDIRKAEKSQDFIPWEEVKKDLKLE